jgi:hypothetical protein
MGVSRVSTAFWLTFIGVLVSLEAPLAASPINTGLLTYDVLLGSTPGFPGVNHFQIWNLTGDPALGGQGLAPDFPIYTPISFTNATVSVVIGNVVQTIPVSDMSPGVFDFPDLEFSSDLLIQSATFTANISPLQFELSTLEPYLADSDQISVTLLPSAGDDLQPGIDLAVITIDATVEAPTEVPEPASFGLACSALGLVVLGMLRARTRR